MLFLQKELALALAQDAVYQPRHQTSQHDRREADQTQSSALDHGHLVSVGTTGLYCKNECESHRSSDGSSHSHDRELLISNRPFLYDPPANGWNSEYGDDSCDDHDPQLQSQEGEWDRFFDEVVDGANPEVDEHYGLCYERNRLKGDSWWGARYVVACIPPMVRL